VHSTPFGDLDTHAAEPLPRHAKPAWQLRPLNGLRLLLGFGLLLVGAGTAFGSAPQDGIALLHLVPQPFHYWIGIGEMIVGAALLSRIGTSAAALLATTYFSIALIAEFLAPNGRIVPPAFLAFTTLAFLALHCSELKERKRSGSAQ
jgi:hypothetical protein